jgi:hypothetical protein
MRQAKFPGGESAKMTDAPAKPSRDITGKDKETLVSIVKEMTESMSGAQSTRHWAEDALWFDIPPFASRGIQPALKFFDKVFSGFQSCKVDILGMDVFVNGNMGLVCTIQRVSVVPKTEDAGEDLGCHHETRPIPSFSIRAGKRTVPKAD